MDRLPPLREVIRSHGLSARRKLGQHFLLDLNITRRIARAAGSLDGADVLEIGPGPGGLTRALLETGARRVVAVERDPRCIAALEPLVAAADGRLQLVEGDALALDAAELLAPPRHIVANLPYNIATPLIVAWLGAGQAFQAITVMVQKEVAIRLAAAPGGRDFGRLSVMAQWRCEARRCFDVPARAFTPAPAVESTVVTLVPHAAPPAPADAECLEQVTRAAFGQRRKMLRTSLKALGVDAAALIAASGVEATARAETLTVVEFCALARAFAELKPDRSASNE